MRTGRADPWDVGEGASPDPVSNLVLGPNLMNTPPVVLEEGEALRAEVPANLFRGWEAVGGRLSITDRRIRFESHRWNGQVGPTEVRLDQVASVRPRNNFWIIPNGLRVEAKDGRSYQFVVWRPRHLASVIREGLPGRVDA